MLNTVKHLSTSSGCIQMLRFATTSAFRADTQVRPYSVIKE